MELALRALVLVSALLCGTSCNSPRRAKASPSSVVVVPLGESRCYLFGASGVEILDARGRHPADVRVPAGAPIAGAVDSGSGWAAVAYPHALAVVNMSEGSVRIVDDVLWEHPPQVLGIGESTIGTLEDDTIALYDALQGKRIRRDDGSTFLNHFGMEELLYVLPLSQDRMLIVAKKSMGLEAPRATVFDVDRKSGVLDGQERPFSSQIHDADACTADGRWLYVAGTHWSQERSLTGGIEQRITAKVLRHDPSTGRNEVFVQEPQRASKDVRVAHVAAGFGLLVMGLEDGRVYVYDVAGSGLPNQVWGPSEVPGLSGIVCVDKDHIALISGADVKLQNVR